MEQIFDPHRAHIDDAHSVLMRLIPAGTRVLELGSSSGYLSGYMEQALGCRVTALDADPLAVQIAVTRCTEAHQVDLESPEAFDIAAAGGPYDVLLAASILEHLKSPGEMLQRVRPLLKPGALVIASLPNIAHWQTRLMLLRGHFDYTTYFVMDRTHLRFYTVDTGRRLLEENGYAVDRLTIAGSGLQNLLNRLARRTSRPLPAPLFPGLLAYELIYVAHA